MKVFISKYALSDGIYETDVNVFEDNANMCQETKKVWPQYFYGNDWHKTREEAVKKAEEMQAKKIISLNKSLAKIKALKF